MVKAGRLTPDQVEETETYTVEKAQLPIRETSTEEYTEEFYQDMDPESVASTVSVPVSEFAAPKPETVYQPVVQQFDPDEENEMDDEIMTLMSSSIISTDTVSNVSNITGVVSNASSGIMSDSSAATSAATTVCSGTSTEYQDSTTSSTGWIDSE